MDDLRLHTLGEVFLCTHSASLQTSSSVFLHLRSLLALLHTSFLGLVRGVNIWNSLRGHRSCRRALFAHHPTQVDTSVDSTNPPETGTKRPFVIVLGCIHFSLVATQCTTRLPTGAAMWRICCRSSRDPHASQTGQPSDVRAVQMYHSCTKALSTCCCRLGGPLPEWALL